MTRKDYEAIAQVLATTTDRENIARSLAQVFEKDNPRFNAKTFLKAARA